MNQGLDTEGSSGNGTHCEVTVSEVLTTGNWDHTSATGTDQFLFVFLNII